MGEKAITSKKEFKVNLCRESTNEEGLRANLEEAFTGVNSLKLNQ